MLLILPCLAQGLILSHTFHFTHIPLDMGERHLHSPEHMGYSWHVKVVESQAPKTSNGYAFVAFRLSTPFGEADAKMLTRQRRESHLVLQDASGDPVCCLILKAGKMGTAGHTIGVSCQLFKDPTLWQRFLLCVLLQKDVWEAAIRWGYASRKEDDNLRAYRAVVLGMPVE